MNFPKFPFVRYKVLDACFRNTYKKYFIHDLVEECNFVISEMTGNVETVKLRQIRDDIAFMRSPQGWNIDLAERFEAKKRVYRYEDPKFSILNLPINKKISEEFNAAVEVLSQFEGMPQFDWLQESIAKMEMKSNNLPIPIISFDTNTDLKGLEFLSTIYESIKHQKVLKVRYQDFKSLEPYNVIFHPYFLKQFNNRWFAFGLNSDNLNPNYNLALDRIEYIEETNAIYEKCVTDWNEYFYDLIGVTKPIGVKVEDIHLLFSKEVSLYVTTKPLHPSQKYSFNLVGDLNVRIKVIPNFELEKLILSFGEQVKVISPDLVKERISLRIKAAGKLY